MNVAQPAEVIAALAAGSRIGPFFTVSALDSALDESWSPLSALVDGSAALGDRIAATRAALATSTGQSEEAVEWRVASSLAHLNLVARILSPPIGTVLGAGIVPSFTWETLWWQPVLGGAFPLSVSVPAGYRADADDAAALIERCVLESVVCPLTDAVSRVGGVSPWVLRGNVASALAAAAQVFAGAHLRRAGAARKVVEDLLRLALLRGAGSYEPSGEAPHEIFRRHSCCLFYRVAAGAGTCGDCILNP